MIEHFITFHIITRRSGIASAHLCKTLALCCSQKSLCASSGLGAEGAWPVSTAASLPGGVRGADQVTTAGAGLTAAAFSVS